MNATLTPDNKAPSTPSKLSNRLLARKSAIVIGFSLSMAVLALLTLEPELMQSGPLWAVWALAMAGVIGAYISGHTLRRKMSGLQSRRTRRWISAHQS